MTDSTRTRGDRDIVFSARHFRFTGKYYNRSNPGDEHLARRGKSDEQTLEGVGTYQLYRINPDGSGLTKIAHTPKTTSTEPKWSPDGRSLLFLRSRSNGEQSVCRADPDGHNVKTIFRLPAKSETSLSAACWAEGGRTILVQTDKLLVLDATTGRVLQRFEAGDSFRVSSQGHVLIRNAYYGSPPRLLELKTGKITPLTDPKNRFYNLGWLSSNTLISQVWPVYSDDTIDPLGYVLLDQQGRPRQPIFSLDPIVAYSQKERDVDNNQDAWEADWLPERIDWHPLSPSGKTLLANVHRSRSDGGVYTVYRVDLTTKKVWLLHRGELIAVSPSGKQCLVATADWVGPYKRGGERCGPLELISTNLPAGQRVRSGKTLTPRLTAFAGGDWR